MAKRVGLVGVTGYTGMELTRILLDHPGLQLTQVTSRKEAGQPLRKIYPFLQGTELGDLRSPRRTARTWPRTAIWSSWPSPTARPWKWPPSCGRRGPGSWT